MGPYLPLIWKPRPVFPSSVEVFSSSADLSPGTSSTTPLTNPASRNVGVNVLMHTGDGRCEFCAQFGAQPEQHEPYSSSAGCRAHFRAKSAF